MTIYVDASTKNNGKHNQQTYVVLRHNNKEIEKKYIGNYSINEGELTAIVYAVQRGATIIYSDSEIAIKWVIKGWTDKHEKSFKKGKLTERHKKMIVKANKMYIQESEKRPIDIIKVSRDNNLAGLWIETKQGKLSKKTYEIMSSFV